MSESRVGERGNFVTALGARHSIAALLEKCVLISIEVWVTMRLLWFQSVRRKGALGAYACSTSMQSQK
jgi:hypothetical protein